MRVLYRRLCKNSLFCMHMLEFLSTMLVSARALSRRHYTLWFLAALLVAWCARAGTFAAEAPSPSDFEFTCEGPVHLYTAEQTSATRDFLMAFTETLPALSPL